MFVALQPHTRNFLVACPNCCNYVKLLQFGTLMASDGRQSDGIRRPLDGVRRLWVEEGKKTQGVQGAAAPRVNHPRGSGGAFQAILPSLHRPANTFLVDYSLTECHVTLQRLSSVISGCSHDLRIRKKEEDQQFKSWITLDSIIANSMACTVRYPI